LLSTSLGKTAMWGGIYVLVLLSLITPLNIVTINFIMVPLLVMVVISDPKRVALVLVILLVLLQVIFQGFGFFLMLLTLFYMVPAAMMGRQYRKGATAGAVILAGLITFIALILFILLLSFSFGFDFTEAFTEYVQSDPNLMSMLEGILGSEDQIQEAIALLADMVPTMIIVFALMNTMIAHWMGRKIITRLGVPAGLGGRAGCRVPTT
jgi:hypothetical protein